MTADQLTSQIVGMDTALRGITMPVGQTVSELDRIERFLRVRNWTRTTGVMRGEVYYTSPKPKDEWQVQIAADGYWALCRFTDSDMPNDAYKGGMEAVGRYESEGATVEALEAAMVASGAIEWVCPQCGEEGGEPRTSYSRELYGADYDGNRGEWREYSEECCSKCIKG